MAACRHGTASASGAAAATAAAATILERSVARGAAPPRRRGRLVVSKRCGARELVIATGGSIDLVASNDRQTDAHVGREPVFNLDSLRG